jgi:CRISPR-associated Csh1 family protein
MLRSLQQLGFMRVGEGIFTIEDFDSYRKENPGEILKLFSEVLPGDKRTVYVLSNENNNIFNDEYKERDYQKYLYVSCGKTGIGYYESLSFLHTGNSKQMLKRITQTLNTLPTSEQIETLKNLIKRPLAVPISGERIPFGDFIDSVASKTGEKILYTFQIDGRFPADFLTPEQCQTLLEWRMREFYKHGKKELKGRSRCAVCSREMEVYGAAHPFNFCTVEKAGFFPEFDNRNAWRSFPVCPGDAILLNCARKHIDQYLHDRLARYNTIYIPVLVGNYSQEEYQRLLGWFQSLIQTRDIEKKGIKEASILRKLGQVGLPIVSYHIILRQSTKNKTQFEIAQHIVDVLPSRISTIAEAIDAVNKEFEGSTWSPMPFSLNFNFLGHIFGFPGQKSASGALTVLDVLESIFVKNLLSKDMLYRSFIQRLQDSFKHPNRKIKARSDTDKKRAALFYDTNNILKLIKFLQNPKLEVMYMPEEKFTKFESKDTALAAWINEAGANLGTPAKRSCFLIGRLFGVVWRAQMEERSSAPISQRLKSLNLTFEDIKKLFGDLVLRLDQYGKLRTHSYLTGAIAQQLKFNVGQDDDSISDDEAILWFVVGWTTYIPGQQEKEKNNDGKQ